MSSQRAGLYLRLSREDEGKDGVSESIKNQQDFLEKYACERNFKVIKVYSDDGYSGTNFIRPAFCEMVEDIERGVINVVITKDLSRLGRDYIMTGHYIEKYFPSKNVRFIAVNDGVDSSDSTMGGDMTPFRSVINDMYARDISKKVRTALTTKKKNGAFIGSSAPYGYQKDPHDKNRLMIDEKAAQYVRLIFKMYLEGKSMIGIASELTDLGIETPSQYKKLTASQKRYKGVWNQAMIRRMLSNPTYIGNITQNRTRKINYKLNKRTNLPQNEWIIVENTHDPIIDKADYETVQRLLSKRSYDTKKRGKKEHLLTGLVFCGDCNSPMTPVCGSGHTYLVCTAWKRHTGLNLCTSHCIREDFVAAAVTQTLKKFIEQYIDHKKLSAEFEKLQKSNTTTPFLSNLQIEIEELETAKLMLYKDKAKGVVDEKDYIHFSKQFENEINMLKKQKELFAESNIQPKSVMDINKILNFKNPDRNLLLSFVNKINIFENKTIEIEFTFKNPAGELES